MCVVASRVQARIMVLWVTGKYFYLKLNTHKIDQFGIDRSMSDKMQWKTFLIHLRMSGLGNSAPHQYYLISVCFTLSGQCVISKLKEGDEFHDFESGSGYVCVIGGLNGILRDWVRTNLIDFT